ncbi:putative ribonuclease H-like domain-containing protein [Tanacetum coccineum]
MTGNKCYLDEYEDYDGGFVSFGDGKGRISRKGKIKTGSLDFNDCLVLSSNFKLLDKSQVLLRVPRKDNIYSVDLKSVVPTGGLTCLIANTTIDESNTWHRRLGHINFKTMSKLVKGNLIKGLPLKIFENDHSCVACQKGKQHKASYKTKLVNSINKPLHMLHMDLFGPTNVKSLMKKIFVNPSHTKKIFANMKREGKDFSGRITPLFDTMMVQDSKEVEHEESVLTPSNDPLPSGEDSMQLNDLMVLCTKLQKHVLDLEKAKSDQAIEIASLKKRVDKLEKTRKFRTTWLKRLKRVGEATRIESLNDKRQDEDLMFDTRVLDDDEMFVDATTGEKDEQSTKLDDSTASEAVTTAGVEDSVALTIQVSSADIGDEGVTAAKIDELTLAQTLIEIKAAKPKVVITVATTTTTTRPKARGVVLEAPLKRKDQVALDDDLARNIQAQLDAEIIEEERLERQKQEEANIALIESWENTQAMMEADRLLAERLQTREREELTDEEKGKLFMELMEKRRKHFAALRAQEKRNRPPTKAQKRSQMSTYLKHMGGYKHKQLMGKSYDEIQKLFDKEMKRVNTFVAMSSEAQESNEKKVEGSEEKAKSSRKKSLGKKRAVEEQQQESPKRQKLGNDKETDEHKEVEADDTAELKKHLVIKKDDDIAIDVIPLATKPPVIVDYKLLKEGIMVHYQLIRADGSSKRHSSMIRLL